MAEAGRVELAKLASADFSAEQVRNLEASQSSISLYGRAKNLAQALFTEAAKVKDTLDLQKLRIAAAAILVPAAVACARAEDGEQGLVTPEPVRPTATEQPILPHFWPCTFCCEISLTAGLAR